MKEFTEKEDKKLRKALEIYRVKNGKKGQAKNYFEPIIKYPNSLTAFFSSTNNSRFKYKDNFIKLGFLALAPQRKSKYFNTCKNEATRYCKKYCIGNSKHGLTQMQAQIKRTMLFTNDKKVFFNQLCEEIAKLVNYALNNNKLPVFRLNGYSDILWEEETFELNKGIYQRISKKLKDRSIKDKTYIPQNIELSSNLLINENLFNENNTYSIFKIFPGILFYDYTKFNPSIRLKKINDNHIKNYHLTFSFSSNNMTNDEITKQLKSKKNIAFIVSKIVFDEILCGIAYKEFKGFMFIDGDLNDYRFLDDLILSDKGKIILLCAQDITIEQTLKENLNRDVVTNIKFFDFLKYNN